VDAAWIRDPDRRIDRETGTICASSASEQGEWEFQTLCDGRQRFALSDGSAEWIIPQKVPGAEGYWAGNLLVARIGSELVTFDPAARWTQTSRMADSSSRVRGIVSRGPGASILVEESTGKPEHRLRAYDVRTHHQNAEYPLDAADRVAIDPSNTYLLRVRIAGTKGDFAVRRVGAEGVLTTGHVDNELIDSVAMSPDGRTFAMALLSGQIFFVDAVTGAIRRPQTLHPVPITGIGVTEHQESLYTTGFDFAHSWDLDWGYPGSMAPYIPDAAMAVSPRGGLALAAKGEVHTVSHGETKAFRMHDEMKPSWLAVSDDGQYAAWLEDAGGGRSDLWLSDGTLLCRDSAPEPGVFSPDSSKLAVACKAGLLRIYDLAARRWLAPSATIREGVPGAYEPEGKRFAAAMDSKICFLDAETLAVKDCADSESEPTALAYEMVGGSDVVAAATEGAGLEREGVRTA